MVERSSRGKKKRKLLGNHQRSWLWGRNLVRETLAAGRWLIHELHLSEELPAEELESACAIAKRQEIPTEVVHSDQLRRLCHASEHQGYLARMGPFPYHTAADLLETASEASLFLILDGIQDPYNFGAILRSAHGFGVDGVFIGERAQTPVSSMVARSSAGSINHVRIAQSSNLVSIVTALRSRNVNVIGASEKSDIVLSSCDLSRGTAIVIGNEGQGISPELANECGQLIRIPLAGTLSSLNAAVATAIFCYESWRQRQR